MELLNKNGMEEAGIKMILTGGYSPDGYEIGTPNLIISQHKLTMPSTDVIDNGIKVITHKYVRAIPEVKSINYIMGIWLQKEIKEQQAADVLYYRNGLVSEFPRCNVFVVSEDDIVSTPARNVLAGITRKNLLKLNKKKFVIRETDITIDDVLNAKEVFLTSTTKRILPIIKVDNTIIGTGKPGSVSLSLLDDLIELENNY
jgi:branched-subunit amino acid aminotransferase/4-amino-4-deoxychorismate lyase